MGHSPSHSPPYQTYRGPRHLTTPPWHAKRHSARARGDLQRDAWPNGHISLYMGKTCTSTTAFWTRYTARAHMGL
jgi:hypothetical protein